MATVAEYLKELDEQRDKLAVILREKGIEASENEKYNTLVEKIRGISSGSEAIAVAAYATTTPAEDAIVGNATFEEVTE